MTKSNDDSLSTFAYHQIRMWMRQEYGPGDRLKEQEVAARLGISRTPVRDAIRRLAHEGLVQNGPSGGFFITVLDRGQVTELYGCREVLEGGAAAHAARHATDVEISELRDILGMATQCDRTTNAFARLNIRFHQAIYDASRNIFIARALLNLSDWLSLLPGSTTAELEGRMEQAHAEHAAILAAIEKRDPAAAESAAREHIRHAGLARRRLMFDDG